MELGKLIGVALLAGVATAATGVVLEVLRAFLTRSRREAILHRTFRENLDHFLRSPQHIGRP